MKNFPDNKLTYLEFSRNGLKDTDYDKQYNFEAK